ncbi:FdhF/YdeP family oxidoreductase [Escherichia coli]
MKKKIESYQGAAGGWGAVKSVANAVRKQMDIRQDVIAMFDMNKPEGFDCPGCAWPDPKHSASFDICENGAKAIAWEVTDKQVNASFFAENTVQSLLTWGDHELEAAGRLTQPLKYDAVSDCYKPLSWQQAFDEIGARLQSYSDPNQVEFYTSGRTSNEAAFLYQLFAREYGSNNFPDCSNMCHEPTSVGLAASIGVGKGTVLLEDFEKCDLVICIGHNPGTNHPRMLTSLRALVKRGAKMIAINPLQERGLERFTAPQNPFEMLTNSETQLASAYYNVRIGGDMALLKGMMRLLIERDDAASAAGRPSLLDDEFIQTHTVGFDELRRDVLNSEWKDIERISGLSQTQIAELADAYAAAERTIICYGMGITQHEHGTQNVQQLVNLLLMKGNIGKPGAGICPLRGHSNVQGDRTVGITEKPSAEFLARLGERYGFTPPQAAENRVWPTKAENHLRFNIINDKENRVNGIALYYRLPMVQVNDEQSFVEQAEWSMLVQLFNQRLQERIQSGELKTISGGTARSVKIAPDYQSLFFRVNARDDNIQDAANALMAELATIDQHGFSAEELDDVKSTRLTWLKNAVDQQAERDLRMLTSRLASSSLNNTPFLSPEETYQLSKRLWQQITVQSLAEKWQQLRKNQDAFWEQMVNNELAAKKALSPAAILALEKEYANKKLAAYIFPGRNLSLTVDADPQAEISSKETLAENLTSLTLSNGARVILAKSAGEEQKLQITAVSNKGDLSFPAQQKSLIALANKAVSGSGVGELSSSSLKRWSAENSVTMSSKVSGMNTLLSVSARTNNPEPGFQLINQRITHSTINDNIWASLQNAQIQALKTLDQRPAEKFAQQMYETRYADDRTKLLQENQIVQFTAADALAADRQLFSSPADITFVIVGNVSEDKLVALITRYLGSIKHSDSPLAAGKPLTRATDNASVTVKEQNEPVAQVSQWKRYDSRTPVNLATRMALDAFNVALAKDLRVNIREQASGAYSVSSRLSVDPQAKDISHLLAFTCQPERHDELLTLANEVMVKRLAKGISEQELNEYQQNVQRSLDIQQRSVQQLANTIVNSLIQYDDPAAWTEQEQLLKQMTVENVNTAVKQYLSHPVNTYTGVLLPK